MCIRLQYSSSHEVKHAPCCDVDGESYLLIPKESTSVTHSGYRERPIRVTPLFFCVCTAPENVIILAWAAEHGKQLLLVQWWSESFIQIARFEGHEEHMVWLTRFSGEAEDTFAFVSLDRYELLHESSRINGNVVKVQTILYFFE